MKLSVTPLEVQGSEYDYFTVNVEFRVMVYKPKKLAKHAYSFTDELIERGHSIWEGHHRSIGKGSTVAVKLVAQKCIEDLRVPGCYVVEGFTRSKSVQLFGRE